MFGPIGRRVVALLLAAVVLRADAGDAAAPRSTGLGGGVASWYGKFHDGKRMANGCKFNRHFVSAAHRSLPLGSWVRISNPDTGAVLAVPIVDRGPFVPGRDFDLSEAAARILGFRHRGTAFVTFEIMPDKPKRKCTGIPPP